MLTNQYQLVAPGTYQKWDSLLSIRTTVHFEGTGDTRIMTVKHEQPKQFIQAVLDRNVAMQNDFSGYKGKEIVQGASMPIAIHKQIMKQCGYQAGHGYDEKRYHRILNDRENYKLKTVPGRI